MRIDIGSNEAEALRSVLDRAKLSGSSFDANDLVIVESILRRHSDAVSSLTECKDHISFAKQVYATDDLEFDDLPAVSVGDEGVWVACWRWVYNSDIEE